MPCLVLNTPRDTFRMLRLYEVHRLSRFTKKSPKNENTTEINWINIVVKKEIKTQFRACSES